MTTWRTSMFWTSRRVSTHMQRSQTIMNMVTDMVMDMDMGMDMVMVMDMDMDTRMNPRRRTSR